MRRAADAGVAAFVTLVGIVTTTIEPGSLIGGLTTAAYVPVERAALLACALCWTSPHRRTNRHAIAIGAVLGLWQAIRFGGAFVAGAAILIVDACSIAADPAMRRSIASWLRSSALIAATFIAFEVLWIALAFGALPRGVARD